MTDTDHSAPGAPDIAARAAATSLLLVAESTDRLLRTVAALDPEALAGPSALPGWTRGHVLAHIARNADSLVNLLDGARTGTDIPQYATPETRDRDIEAGAPRPLDVQLADVRDSSARFTAAAAELDEKAWTAEVRHRAGFTFEASEIPWKRLMEVEYHHVDLAAGHTPAHWPEEFATAEFRRLAAKLDGAPGLPAVQLVAEDTGERARIGDRDGEPALTAEGPVRALTAWLSGRSAGDGLQVHRGDRLLSDARAALPELPPLG
ncbi:maleylpyruvate isomerase [Kitasatospora herbaricolor]|uniref:maleylpyruvate isomerase family mycothiol-dependent enzyme n=1 Tax=Kitasatospora herbaricolor TaxID=68217 RepID=UPI00174DDF00|nr:maleylpyruvate isomerase family mycothiol-dependent enzyme [Kitasatospora herbaricolor]MDQ0311084.1 maleylpyruvate isomerase [Kitasatospora herbaricolor]GGV12101.1 maleylpyruvate isomerase [Kitasatospora herbaricolor]